MLETMERAVRIRLSEILEERKMTQRELARGTGISVNTISKVTNGSPRQIRLETLYAICSYLNIGIEDLVVFEKDR